MIRVYLLLDLFHGLPVVAGMDYVLSRSWRACSLSRVRR